MNSKEVAADLDRQRRLFARAQVTKKNLAQKRAGNTLVCAPCMDVAVRAKASQRRARAWRTVAIGATAIGAITVLLLGAGPFTLWVYAAIICTVWSLAYRNAKYAAFNYQAAVMRAIKGPFMKVHGGYTHTGCPNRP